MAWLGPLAGAATAAASSGLCWRAGLDSMEGALVAVGGVSFDAQAVEVAEQVSDSFTEDSNNDGLLGLAFSTLNTVIPTAQKTFFDNIQSSLDEPLFTADLRHDARK